MCNLTKAAPNIATSVRLSFFANDLSYEILNRMKRNWWMIKQTIIVHKTVPSTYFGVIQIPGIYAGIQQLPDNECRQRKSKQIFAMFVVTNEFDYGLIVTSLHIIHFSILQYRYIFHVEQCE